MKIGYVVGFLTPQGVSAGVVVNMTGRESLVVKEPGIVARFIRLFKGEALKIDTCGVSAEFSNAVRQAVGVKMYDSPLSLDGINVVTLSDLTPDTAPELDEAPAPVAVSTKAPKSLSAFKRIYGTETVALAVKQIRHKKAFTALPKELKAGLKKLITR